ncbi:hypothetical protein HK101_010388 [Irineochytrium annulatum]|nr:hypothetical protein HK101_010388 [Irineochytrium annulatum]
MSGTSGTSTAIFGLAALTLPSFVSRYHIQLGISEKLTELNLISRPHTLITHMFEHRDVYHLAGNLFTLFSVGLSLDVGFVGTLALFVGGGLAGVGTQVLEVTLKKRADAISYVDGGGVPGPPKAVDDALSWILRTATGGARKTIRERPFGMCGASAGIYALMGAELMSLSVKIYHTLRRLSRLRSGSPRRQAEAERLRSFSAIVVGHLINILTQVLALDSGGDYRLDIGHAAHVGGPGQYLVNGLLNLAAAVRFFDRFNVKNIAEALQHNWDDLFHIHVSPNLLRKARHA